MTWLQSLFDQTIAQKIENVPWINHYTPVLIYGTGTFAQDIYHTLVDHGLPVLGFLDHIEREKNSLNGIPIYKPDAARTINRNKTVVVLGIHNYQADIPQIIQRLNNTGFQKIVSSVELYDYFGSALGVRYWLTSRSFYLPLRSILEEAYSLWSDEASKSLFQSIIKFRLTGDASKLPVPDLTPYHPVDLPLWQTPLRFIDCGAYDGDTLADFIKSNIPFQSVAAFEPDLKNCMRLTDFANSQKEKFPNIFIYPCGVYSSTTQLSFETGREMASAISGKGTTMIQCVALDDVLPNFAPNLIKMDIEGSEYEALLGARQTIAAHTPGLALSLYHRPEHLWQLPLLVESIAPHKYRFFMRSHARNDFELVLYAMPVERK